MKSRRTGAMLTALCLMLAGCGHVRGPEETTDDGLVRVPSRAAGGVYRNPDATFTQYKRVMIEPLSVEFLATWRDSHPEVSDAEVQRIQIEAIELFRKEFVRELVDQGPYELADTREADVLMVIPRVVDLDIPAPNGGTEPGQRSYSPRPVAMQMTGELRDAVSGALLFRVICYEGQQQYGFNELRIADRTSRAHELRLGFGKWSRLVREALDVAKVARPRAATAAPQ
jgi:hypothetical protein